MASAERAPDTTLALLCPKCEHVEARLFVSSYTILTVICAKCSHAWSVEIAAVPPSVRSQLPPLSPR